MPFRQLRRGAGRLFEQNLNSMLEELFEGAGGSLPSGGTTGQVLTKQSDTDGDAVWEAVVLSGGSP